MTKRIASLLAFLSLIVTAPGAAQDRELHWRRLDVNARLDADGRLHVRERQTMVFTGDWNGGERTFNLRRGQELELHSITRVDAAGSARHLQRGSLDYLDHFDWTDSYTLRWRSRTPTDPVFLNQEIIYELDYTLSNILLVEQDGYTLDHDFAFPNRAGMIESFVLDLTADDVWRSTTPLPLHLEQSNLEPYTSVVMTIPLQHTGASAPAGVTRGLPLTTRLAFAVALLGIVAYMLRNFFVGEKARGRFEPLIPVESIDQAWLDAHVFNYKPEVVGTIWDNTTSSPEVAAMIARMVQEGKLASRVETKRWRDVLHLELKVNKADLESEERQLINALFTDGKKTTDTERIKKRYSGSGFDPAGLIKSGIDSQIRKLLPGRAAKKDKRDRWINAAVVVVVSISGILTLMLSSATWLFFTPMVVGGAGFLALIFAGVYRTNVIDTAPRARNMVVFLAIAALPVLAIVLGLYERGAELSLTPRITPAQTGMTHVVGLMLMYMGIVFVTLRAARTVNDDPERMEMRRTLAAGRMFFVRELKKPEPSLDDAWYPYLIAFGLGRHIDKWFRAFGGLERSTSMSRTAGMAMAGSSSSGSWSGGGPMFGGGGGFGGGGTGRTWAAAAAGMSAGVSAPSSSSSSSGGGSSSSGGSSGGGGGGGW